MIQKQECLKYFAGIKLFHSNERQKSVHAGASLVFLFLIGKVHWIVCPQNKNIGNICQEVRSFNQMKDRNWFIQELLQFFFS